MIYVAKASTKPDNYSLLLRLAVRPFAYMSDVAEFMLVVLAFAQQHLLPD